MQFLLNKKTELLASFQKLLLKLPGGAWLNGQHDEKIVSSFELALVLPVHRAKDPFGSISTDSRFLPSPNPKPKSVALQVILQRAD